LEKFQLTEQFGTVVQGFYTFNNSGPLTTGNPLADMFLGKIQNYTEGTFNNHGVYTGGYGVGHWRRTDFEPYIQDDWKISRRLTINLGVRYYMLIPSHDVTHPTVDSNFIPSLYNPAAASVLGADGLLHQNPATGQVNDFTAFGNGLVECGVGTVAKGCQVPYRYNIGPRFGFAYDPTGSGKTSIRGGFGIYYEPGNGNGSGAIGLEGNPPTTLGPIRYNINGYNFGSGGFAGVSPADIQSIPYFQKNPAVSQYNLNVQHEFRGSNVMSVAYVGTAGRRLDSNRNMNQIPIPVGTMNVPALAGGVNGSLCDAQGNCNVQSDLIQNSGDTNYFRPYQGFGNIRQKQFTSVSSYNALQTNFRHTTGYGLTMQVAYTWSHMIDNSTSGYNMSTVDENYDMSRWKATADLNRTNVLSINYIYALPFFKHASSAFVRQSAGGWQVSGITAIMSGPPTGFYGCGVAGYNTGIGGTYDCNPVGPLKIAKSTVNDPTYGPMVQWFDPATVAQPTLAQLSANGQPGMFGYMSRNPLTGPGRNNWDLALFKDVQFPWFRGEHSTLQLRLETFNSFNHTQWQGVNTSCNGNANADGSPAFGRSCGGSLNTGNAEVNSAWNPRNIQLGIKYLF